MQGLSDIALWGLLAGLSVAAAVPFARRSVLDADLRAELRRLRLTDREAAISISGRAPRRCRERLRRRLERCRARDVRFRGDRFEATVPANLLSRLARPSLVRLLLVAPPRNVAHRETRTVAEGRSPEWW